MTRPATRQWPVGVGVVVALLIVGVGIVSVDRGVRGRFDFSHFYRDACYVWQHGTLNPLLESDDPDATRQLPFYLPIVSLALAPLGALPRTVAAIIWALLQMLAAGYSIMALVGVVRRRAGDRELPTLIVLLLLALPVLWEAAKFNQVSFFVLALIIAGWRRMARGRMSSAGALLGVALVLKLLPGIFLPWLLLKRRWAAAAMMLVVAVAIAIVPCLAVFGPSQTVTYHAEWMQYNRASGTGALNPALRDHFVDHRNQSIRHVLARWVWPAHPHRLAWQPLHLSERATGAVAWGLLAALLLGLWWLTRRSWDELRDVRRDGEFAVYALGMIVFSPLLRQYYLVWALPALTLLACWAGGRSPRRRTYGWIGIVVWSVGMLAWLSETARAGGVHLLMLIVLGMLLLRGSRAGRRRTTSA